MTATPERHVPFAQVYNFRDLGGYRTRDGRSVRWRRLFRSAELQRMSADEAAWGRETLGIATVIDFRSEGEADDPRGVGPIAEPPARRHHLPMGNARTKFEARDRGTWDPAYVPLLEQHGAAWAQAFRVLAAGSAYPALFHCVTGKDRTGVMAALVLDALGVDEETILADYALSQEHMDRLVADLRARGVLTPDEAPNPGLGVVPAAMREMLDALRARHGGARAFLRAHGVEDGVFARLEEHLLDPAAPSAP